MGIINILDEEVANKIAAGEVIERPASVVKELIENSIDALSKKIIVEVKDGGKKEIVVVDDGTGMSKEDAMLAFERYATSKIRKIEDLNCIKTLGFRGEALSSIAAVAKVELLTRQRGCEAVKLFVDTEIKKTEECGSGYGTTVIVKDIFSKLPARKKFLSSSNTELGKIADVVTRYALAYPNLFFRLSNDGKDIIVSPKATLIEKIANIYGNEVARELIEAKFENEYAKLYGFVSKPIFTKKTRNFISFFVNKRYTISKLLNRALRDAYSTSIPIDRYPVAVLFIDLDYRDVDVNVHPTKIHVKFLNEEEIYKAVVNCIKTAIISRSAIPTVKIEEKEYKQTEIEVETSVPIEISEEKKEDKKIIRNFIPIGQAHNTYIIAQDEEGIAIIDQHVAHERILFEALKADVKKQKLITPIVFEVSQKEKAILEYFIPPLSSLGLSIEIFGKNSFIVRTAPVILGNVMDVKFMRGLIEELVNYSKTKEFEEAKKVAREKLACHAAVKAGTQLRYVDMVKILDELKKTENPYTCPHGRPIISIISTNELNRYFKR
ncbi:MAG: DNA mismatch repair endonuclease MutL [Candidatus Thermoplasmatota archaeon]